MSKLWGGRFEKGLDETAKQFSYSYDIDRCLFPYDIETNLVHAQALEKIGILTQSELTTLESALNDIANRFDNEDPTLLGDDEDIHSAIERLVTESCGDIGKKLHTGKSRNDQVSTDVRLFLKEAIQVSIIQLNHLLKTLYALSDKYIAVIIPGMTHFQPAQPVSFAHHLLAYFEMFSRDKKRLEQAFHSADVCPLGSGALAGNNYGLDRQFIANELGFSKLTQNSMDAVSDRDYIVEYISASALIMTHMSRFCEELVLWSSPLIGFIEIGDTFTTGSSIMPQKKNPDIAELIRGKSSRVVGHLTSLLHNLKSLPLTYNRDLQEDKYYLFDTVDTINPSLDCMAKMLKTITLNMDNINAAVQKGYMVSTELADYLVKNGIPFREAHEITGKLVLKAIETDIPLQNLSLDDMQLFCPEIKSNVFEILSIENAVSQKDVLGGTAFKQIKKQLKRIKGDNKW
ncbi:MAG: argininosuccinate lyase [Candidatus Margulisbacteria bacterium]|nr:argininosuccinate lyase [Candidatus Margulisiibacteriota bacterium]